MKNILIALVCVACACAMNSQAADGKKKKELTAEQKTLQKAMIDKYDADKNGKLSKEERGKMTKEEKTQWKKAGLDKKSDKKAEKKPEAN